MIAGLIGLSARADFSNTVMSYNPAGYWPLNETAPTPQAEVATNLGTLGPLGNAYYLGNTANAVNHTVAGALTDGDTAATFSGTAASMAIPRTSPGLVVRPPFSVEFWVNQMATSSGLGLVAGGRNSDLGSSIYSGFTVQTASGGAVSFLTYNRGATTPALVLTSPTQNLGFWRHVVATYSSSSVATLYVDGVAVGTTTNGYFPSFAPEFQIASQGGLAQSLFTGSLDEIAIYTNLLSASDVSNHYSAGTNATPPTAYKDLVLIGAPLIYLRLDEPVYIPPSSGTFAVANNYGTVGSTGNGLYQPGTLPGVAGPPYSGFGSANYACAFNGLNGAVDCGQPAGLLPTGNATNQPISVCGWLRCNPADFRFQTVLGRGDSAWRVGLNGNNAAGHLGWNPGIAGGADLSPTTLNANDGKWHFFAGVINNTNGRVIYVDGGPLSGSTGVGVYGTVVTNLLIGGAPDYITARGLGSTRYFAGTLCQIAYFTNALTSSDIATLYAAAGISIVTPPVSQAVVQGTPLSLTVNARGPGPLNYQWLRDGSPLAGATDSAYSVASTTTADGAGYSVIVSNAVESITSSAAAVAVITSAAPSSTYATAVLSLNPVGYWPLTETNAAAFAVNYGSLGGTVSGRYQYGADAGIVSGPGFGGFGGATAARFHRWGGFIDLGTAFGLIPTNRAPLSFVTWFQGPNDIRFQGMAGHGDAYWRAGFDNGTQKNRFNPGAGTELAGVQNMNDGAWHQLAGVSDGTNEVLYIDGVVHATNVANVISGAIIPTNQNHAVIGGAPDYGAAINYQVTSTVAVRFWDGNVSQVAFYTNALTPANIATLYGAAQVPPLITLQPGSGQIRYAGTPLSLTVGASGSPPLSYQWYRGAVGLGTPLSNGGSVSGATNTTLTINPSTVSDTNFYVVVSNPYNSVTSILASITIISLPTNPYPAIVIADNPLSYWRLGETNLPSNGTTAYDFLGGRNGMYSNVLVGVDGYRSASDPNTAVLFGTNRPNSYVASIPGIDFGRPLPNNAAFSIECWAMGAIAAQTNDAGVVTKGTGAGGEQFNLDCGGPLHAFRFFVRNAAGVGNGNANGTVGPELSIWHHVVGVCDQAAGKLYLYVDGKTNGTGGTLTANSGILSSTAPMTIASRQSGAATVYDLNLVGRVDEVAVYGYALTATQVQNHYFAAGVAPTVILPTGPTNVTVAEGANVTLPSAGYGSPTLRYQWWDDVLGGPLLGKTNSTLVLSNVTVAGNDQHGYYVVISNAFGTATSPSYVLTVVSGPPQIIQDVPSTTVIYPGRTGSLTVTVGGTPPFSYFWKHENTNLVNDGRIFGANSNVLTITGALFTDAGNYQAVITNAQGSALSAIGSVIIDPATMFHGGAGWSFNTLGTVTSGFSGNTVTLTDGGGDERSAAWSLYPQYIGAFTAFFTYQDVTGANAADGVAFVLQNDPSGASALGAGGGSLGYVGIQPSVGLEFNIYTPNTVGYKFVTNILGSPYLSTSPVVLNSGNPIDVGLYYDGQSLTMNLTNQTTLSTFSTTLPVGDLTIPVGGQTAYVGVSGGTGATFSTQTISAFSFVPLPKLAASNTATNTVLITWPDSVGGYKLQSASDISAPVWVDTGVITTAGGLNQVIITPADHAYYRLTLAIP